MLSTLKEIILSNLSRLPMLWQFGLLDLEKQRRDTILGWFWVFAHPLLYMLIFGGAVWLGMRGGLGFESSKPYLLWVASGLFPWFFIQAIFSKSANAIKKQSRALKLNAFSPSVAPSISLMSGFIIFLICYGAMLIVALPFGAMPTLYWIQIPLLAVLMVLFCYCFSLFASCLSAISKDFCNLVGAMSLPFFWFSDIIIPISNSSNEIVQTWLTFNPIAFIVMSFRDAVYFDEWIFNDPYRCLVFLGILIVTGLLAWFNYHRLKSEVLDAAG